VAEKMKFRIGMMEWYKFGKGDDVLFHVAMRGGNGFMHIPTDYIEADSVDEAKKKLHAYVDRIFDHREHMAMLERVGAESKQRHQELVRDLREVQSLTIGEDVAPPPPPPAPAPAAQSDLLDLCGEVLGENGTGKNNA